MPDWLTKLGTYATDKGTLIRVGTFVAGGAIVVTGLTLILFGKGKEVATTVAKVVK